MHNQKNLKIMVYLFYKNNLIIHLKEQKFNDKNCHCITQLFLFLLTHVCRKKKNKNTAKHLPNQTFAINKCQNMFRNVKFWKSEW